MTERWEVKKIGDLCNLMTGGTPSRSKKEYFEGGNIKWLVSGDIHQREIQDCEGRITQLGLENSNARFLPENSVMIALNGQGKTRGTVALLRTEATCNQSLVSIYPKDLKKLLPEYLYINLHGRYEEIRKITGDSGNDRRGLNMPLIRKIEIPVPPLEEQKRIVAILDEAFEGIEKAQANAEQNLANARELFDSHLNAIFIRKGDDWREEKLSETCVVERGSSPRPIKAYLTNDDDGVNWIKIGDTKGITKYISSTKEKITPEGAERSRRVDPGDFILTNSMSYGRPYIMDTSGYIHDGWFVLRLKENIDTEFFYYLLSSRFVQEQFGTLAAGSVVKNISSDLVKRAILFIPPKEEQIEISKKADQLSEETQRLASIYEQKLKDLAELKQSLLQKAFSGELTSSNVVAFTRPVSEQQAVATTSPEFAANVLAYAHNWHASQQRDRTFGRVKAQKVLHMAESVAGVDMGRQPIKDAAGPNDFQHMLRAEDWAKNNLFFEFTPRLTGNGYDFKKLGDYNKLIGGALEAVKPYKDKLEKILALMMPMNTREAEVLATVHAAWNNLLLDNAAITDDAIIHEARENWTESKRSIPENEFRKAITTIRNNGIVPNGTAKRVTGQESLPL